MRKQTKWISMLLAVFLGTVLLLAGCGSNNSGDGAQTGSGNGGDAKGGANSGQTADNTAGKDGIDTSKEVKLVMYLLGEAPKGMNDMTAELNKKLKQDINATIEFKYIGWGDLQSKYPLVLASGEQVDLMYTADWAFYAQEASKGAFMEITDDMFHKYMPLHAAATKPEIWKGTKLSGKQYMVPTSTPDRKVNMILIRKDLREKYGVPEIKKLSELEPYLAAIKKNNPEMVPMNLDSQTDLSAPFIGLAAEKFAYVNLSAQDPSYIGYGYDGTDKSGKITYQLEGASLEASKAAAATMKDWYDKGYINKNPYANKVRSKDNFCVGKSGIAIGNSIDLQATMDQCKSKGIDVDLIPLYWPDGTNQMANPMNNGVAVGANSENPERALMALDLIMEDPVYDQLVYFGVEGKNYIIKDGKVALPDGVTAEANTYPPDAAGFWFTNKDIFKPMASWTPQYISLKEELKRKLITPVYSSFSFSTDNVKTQVANIAQVSAQYAYPIYIGAFKDVDDAFKTLDSKLKAAGIEDIGKEVLKQTEAYMAAKK